MRVLLNAKIDTKLIDGAALYAPADAAGLDLAVTMADAAGSCVAWWGRNVTSQLRGCG